MKFPVCFPPWIGVALEVVAIASVAHVMIGTITVIFYASTVRTVIGEAPCVIEIIPDESLIVVPDCAVRSYMEQFWLCNRTIELGGVRYWKARTLEPQCCLDPELNGRCEIWQLKTLAELLMTLDCCTTDAPNLLCLREPFPPDP